MPASLINPEQNHHHVPAASRIDDGAVCFLEFHMVDLSGVLMAYL